MPTPIADAIFKQIFDISPVLMGITEIETGEFIAANQAFAALLGYTPEELIGKKSTEMNIYVDLEDRRRVVEKVKKEGKVIHYDLKVRSKDGSIFSVLFSVTPFKYEGKVRLLTTAADVTQREEVLRTTQRLLGEVQRITKVGGWQYDINTQKVFWTKGVYRIHELPDEFDPSRLDPDIDLFYPGEAAATLRNAIRNTLSTGVPYDLILPFRTAKGNDLWVRLYGSLELENGKPLRLYGTILDITDAKKSEEANRLSEQRYRNLFENMQEGVALHEIICDPQGKPIDYIYLDANPAYERLTGLKREATLGRRVKQVLPNLDEFWIREYGEVALKGGTKKLENFVKELNKYYNVTVYQTAQGQFAVVFDDVTLKRQIQDEQNRAQKLESLGLLAGGIAHDFNNLLMGIMGNISFARLQMGDNSPIASQLENSEKAIDRAAQLTRQLLTFAKGGAPTKKLISAAALLTDASVFSLRGSAIKAEVEIAPDLWPIEADEGQISQVFNNLLINADQAMQKRGGRIWVRAQNFVQESETDPNLSAGTYVKIEVQDQGCGIAPEHLSKIFDPYFTTKEKGSGLGLTSAYSIVKRHGGHIQVTSRLNEGSVFTVYLPAVQNGEVSHSPRTSTVSQGSGRILLMDDDPAIRDVGQKMLEAIGYQVTVSKDGANALEMAQQAKKDGAPFAVAILDLTVPGGLGGRDIAKPLLELQPNIHLIASSGYSSDNTTQDFAAYGFIEILPKPYRLNDVASLLNRLLKKK